MPRLLFHIIKKFEIIIYFRLFYFHQQKYLVHLQDDIHIGS
jgi:hypothetical protein